MVRWKVFPWVRQSESCWEHSKDDQLAAHLGLQLGLKLVQVREAQKASPTALSLVGPWDPSKEHSMERP